MKTRVLCLALCVVAFVLSMFMMMHLIDSNIQGGSENVPDELPDNDTANTPVEPVEYELSEAAVAKISRDTEAFIESLASGCSADFVNRAPDFVKRLSDASAYVRDELGLAAGSSYLSKVSEILNEALNQTSSSNTFFSDKTSSTLASLDSLYSRLPADENIDLYPKFDTTSNGTMVLALLAAYQNVQNVSNSQNGIITLNIGGNVLLGDPLISADGSFWDEYTASSSSPAYPFGKLSPLFMNDDMSMVTLLNPITESTSPSDGTSAYKGMAAYLKSFTFAGIDSLSLASEHMLDYGVAGYDETIQNLYNEGLGYSMDNGVAYIHSSIGKIAHISYDAVSSSKSNADIIADVKNMVSVEKQNGAALVVLSVNWETRERDSRGEYKSNASRYESHLDANNKDIGRAAIDSGADIVIGRHSHVTQGIELYKGKLIVYGLGDLSYSDTRDTNYNIDYTFILQQSFKLENGIAVPLGYKIFPAVNTSEDGKFVPRLVFDSKADEIVAKLIKDSGYFTNSIKSFDYIRISK